MKMFYKLVGEEVTECESSLEWGRWFENIENRIIDFTELDGIQISTVFLGIDHSWQGGEPVLFESMVFGGPHDQHCCRYHTYKEAFEGHWKIVKCLKEGTEPSV